MAIPPEAGNAVFHTELAFRPQTDLIRARSLSPLRRVRTCRKKQSVALTIREKSQVASTSLPLRLMSHTSGITKKGRGELFSNPIIAEEDEAGPAVVRSGKTKAVESSDADPTSALDSMTLNMTVAQRVARRRRMPVVPFLPRRTRVTTRATRAMTKASNFRHPAPVFGTVGLPPTDPDEIALGAALKKPQVKLVNHRSELPQQVWDNTEGLVLKLTNDTDDESDEENPPVREGWSSWDLRDEKKRRLDVFHARAKGSGAPYQCDGCNELIIGTRYECKFCDNYDLCRDCYTEPTITYEHQHVAGETMVR